MFEVSFLSGVSNDSNDFVIGKNIKLHSYQKEIFDLAINCNYWKYFMIWPRAGGKDTVCLFLAVYYCLHYSNYTALYINTTKVKASEVASSILEILIPDLKKDNGIVKHKNSEGVFFSNGSRIIFLSAEPSGINIRGLTFQFVILSEVGYYNIGCIELLNSAILPRLHLSRKTDLRNHFLLVNSTTSGSRFFNYIYKNFLNDNLNSFISKKSVYELTNYCGNRIYTDEYLDEIKKQYDDYTFKSEFLMQFKCTDSPLYEYSESIVFKDLSVPLRPLTLVLDWGSDSLVAIFLELFEGKMFVYSYITDVNNSIKKYVSKIHEHVTNNNIFLSRIILPFDTAFNFLSSSGASRKNDSIKTFLDFGFVRPLILKKVSIDFRIDCLRSFQDKTIFNGGCEYLLHCLENFSYNRKDKAFSHACDALTYFSVYVFLNSGQKKIQLNAVKNNLSVKNRMNKKINCYIDG